MIVAVAMAIFGDMGVDQVQTVIFKRRIGVLNVRPSGAQAFHLRAEQDKSRLELLMNEVVVAGLTVFRDIPAHYLIRSDP